MSFDYSKENPSWEELSLDILESEFETYAFLSLLYFGDLNNPSESEQIQPY